MYYLDHRLGKILSDVRIEQARALRERNLGRDQSDQLKQRLGLWLIAKGENLSEDRPEAA